MITISNIKQSEEIFNHINLEAIEALSRLSSNPLPHIYFCSRHDTPNARAISFNGNVVIDGKYYFYLYNRDGVIMMNHYWATHLNVPIVTNIGNKLYISNERPKKSIVNKRGHAISVWDISQFTQITASPKVVCTVGNYNKKNGWENVLQCTNLGTTGIIRYCVLNGVIMTIKEAAAKTGIPERKVSEICRSSINDRAFEPYEWNGQTWIIGGYSAKWYMTEYSGSADKSWTKSVLMFIKRNSERIHQLSSLPEKWTNEHLEYFLLTLIKRGIVIKEQAQKFVLELLERNAVSSEQVEFLLGVLKAKNIVSKEQVDDSYSALKYIGSYLKGGVTQNNKPQHGETKTIESGVVETPTHNSNEALNVGGLPK